MSMSFHRIAYEALDVCNAVEMATLDAAVQATHLTAGARALDIGTGNAAVAIRQAERFGFAVDAVELDAAMADLAAERIAVSPARDRIVLHRTRSADVLATNAPFDLITALGSTEPVGGGVRDPAGMFAGLHDHLAPDGWLLWGDLVWLSEPPAPLRQLMELSNTYADDAGWCAAATGAGFTVVSAEISPQPVWDRYDATMQTAVADWLAAHPDHADAPAVAERARQLTMMFQFGHGLMGFGLYLLKRA